MNENLEKMGIRTFLSVGELAARSGVAVSTLHFYERKGLIRCLRTEGNQRRFTRDTLRRVAVIRVAQMVGISLADIGQALATLPAAAPGQEDWQRLSQRWHDDLSRRIEQLTRLRDTLSDCIGCGCLSVEKCKLRNPLDSLAEQGAGPRRLLDDDSNGED